MGDKLRKLMRQRQQDKLILTEILRALGEGTCKLTAAEIKAALMKNEDLTTTVRLDEFYNSLGLLIERTTKQKLFINDRTQPKLKDTINAAIREAVWRLAEVKGYKSAERLASYAVEEGLMGANDLEINP